MGDFGLDGICERHDVLVFDYPALIAPFPVSPSYNDALLRAYGAALKKADKRCIPMALLHVLNRSKGSSALCALMSDVFDGKTGSIGYKSQKFLRKKSIEISETYGVSEEDRHSAMLALALARDTTAKNGERSAYLTDSDRNIRAFNETRAAVDMFAERAVAYRYNAQTGIFVPG